MLATSARTVPCIALASGLAALNVSVSPFFSIAMLSLNRCDSEPSGPLTEISPAVSVTSTLGGNLIGLFPMRDMASSFSGDDADHFAADAARARLAVGHEAARGRDDGDAQSVHHARDLVLSLVNAQPRLGYSLDFLDDRTTCVILQRDLQLWPAFLADDGEALDIALVLQHFGDRHLDLGRRHLHGRLLRELRIPDARQHVGNRISHAHVSPASLCLVRPYQLALTTPGISPRIAMSRSLLRPSPNLRYTPRGRPVSLHRLRNRVALESRGSCSNLRRAASRCSSENLTLRMSASSSARFLAYFFTASRRLWSRLMTAVFAMAPSVLERKFERGEQRLRLSVGLCSRRDRDVHASQRVYLVVLDFRKNDLLLDAQVEVAAAV